MSKLTPYHASTYENEPITHREITNNLHHLISHFDLDIAIISQLLIQSEAIISGSSILKVLTVQDMSLNVSSDLDVYVKTDQYDDIACYLEKVGYQNFSYKTREQAHQYFRIKHITAIKKYSMPETNKFIDIIISDDPIGCIKHYDFQFLLNWYDGTSIKLVNPESLIKKVSYVNTLTEKFSESRKNKYTRRGYTIIDNKERRFDFQVYNWNSPPSIPIAIRKKNLCQLFCNLFKV